jgi:large subunit ribosomal protein L13
MRPPFGKAQLGRSKLAAPKFFRQEQMKTYSAKPETVQRDWYIVDAADKTLGRLAAGIATRLRGKHKPEYTPHVDTGDYIVVVNVDKIRVTGNKAKGKIYHSHTGYPGGLKSISFEKLMEKAPERTIQNAVKGMLPKGPLGRAMFKKLKVYVGEEHPHAAQQPQDLNI